MQHKITLNVARKGNKETYNKFPMFISTEETTIGLFSNDCKACLVDRKYYS
jgi:hypothetical protein